jgi:1-acyl-sn-glycerol-3-phosphate acyltransferase
VAKRLGWGIVFPMSSGALSQASVEDLSARLLGLVREVSEELHPGRELRRLALDSSLDKDLGLDSLGRAELLTRLEKAFDVGLPESLVASAETPRDLLRAVRSAGKAPGVSATAELEPLAAPLDEAEAAPHNASTLVEVLEWHVDRHPDRRHVAFLPSDGVVEELTYGGLYERACRIAAGLEAAGLEPGQAAGLMLPSGLDYFASFFGVLIAGAVPVPLYPPVRPSQLEDHLRRQAGILNTAQARVLVAMPEVMPLARLVKALIPTLGRVVTVAELNTAAAPPRRPVLKEQDIAFLQFTSGSTSDPKGVILTHANLLANLRAIDGSIDLGPKDTVVSWLPLYHDMGLIGAWMGSLYFAMQLVLMSPLAFLTRPSRWLKAVHRYRGTLSAAPNFAYELCLKKIDDSEIEGLDLSSWRASLNGAEPVSPETIRRFTERFSAYGYKPGTMLPVYGLAESSLAVTFPPWGREPRIDAVKRLSLSGSGEAAPAEGDEYALRFVGCGYPLPRHEIRIVDATGAELAERREGSIQFRGPSATSGYFRNPEATRRLFDGDWLDSGDRGYIAEGELFITGRAKDMIIRAGRNIYPQELEEAVGDLEGVRKGCVAVFGSADPASGTERLVVLAETRETDETSRGQLTDDIQNVAVDLAGTPADDVVLVAPQTVPKTSSGKIRRAAGRELYEGGRLGSRGPVWWQVARLALSGAKPQLKRSAQTAGEVLYAGRFWLIVGLATLPVAVGVALLPKLTRRRRVARGAARQLAKLTSMPIRIDGLDNLRGGGPLIVAANHASYLDAFALTAALPTEGAFLAKRELTQSFLARLLLERLGTLFVERFDAEKSVEDTQRALDAIRDGESLLFFPEGTFDRAPGLRPFRMGAFYVAAQARAPVVPVAIRGTRSMLRGDDWFPRRGAITVTVRPPISPEGTDLAAAVRLRDKVRKEILSYCGEPDLVGEPTAPSMRAKRRRR